MDQRYSFVDRRTTDDEVSVDMSARDIQSTRLYGSVRVTTSKHEQNLDPPGLFGALSG